MDHNPKYIQAQKDGKAPLEYIPLRVLPGVSKVLEHGASKYGIRNWRKDPILESTYKASVLRHLMAWSEGEELDPDSGLSHLYHIIAGCMVVLDAQQEGTSMNDLKVTESKGDVN